METIIKRENGNKVAINVELHIDGYHRNPPEYLVTISTCAKGKRTWINQDCSNDYEYRYNLKFGSPERKEYEHKFYLQFATEEEIYQAKLNLWESIKPTKI
jgi:hypothetical protein